MFIRLRRWFAWAKTKKIFALAAILITVFGLYFWHLGKATAGISPAEAAARASSSNIQVILDNPVNAPHKLLQLGLQQLQSGSYTLRLTSVLFALLFVAAFYLLIRLWFGKLIALMGSLLFAASPWLVVVSRSGVSAVLLLAPLLIIAEFLWITRRKSYLNLAWLFFVLTVAVSLYIPGLIWLIVVGGAVKWKELSRLASTVNGWVASLSMITFLIIITPLVLAIGKNPEILRELFLIPNMVPDALDTLRSIGWMALGLIWRLPYTTDLTVGRLPLLTITQIALATFGFYGLLTKARREVIELLSVLVASILLAGINDQLLLLIPAVMVVCILAAAGLRFLYVEWREIFPRNPIPRGLAVVLILILVSIQLVYGWRYALITWPNTAATQNTYVIE